MSNFRFASHSAPNVSKHMGETGVGRRSSVKPYSGDSEPKVDRYAAQYKTDKPWLQTADGALGNQPNVDLRKEESAIMAPRTALRQNRTVNRAGGLVSNDGSAFIRCCLM